MATSHRSSEIQLFLCGDVMTGRGIDQVLPFPGDPTLYEPYVRDARDYVTLAEQRNGAIPRGAPWSYVWGVALQEFRCRSPEVKIVNLETAVTASHDAWPGKGIHYRMNPKNIACLQSAEIDCCNLANNHVLDWGYTGLEETLGTLERAEVKSAGAGRTLAEAQRLAVFLVAGGRSVAVLAGGSTSSGIPHQWAAGERTPGVYLIDERDASAADKVGQLVAEHRRGAGIVVVSIHWGPNWGYEIPPEQREFARSLIDRAGVDLVFGHSSHHVKGLEIYRGKLIIYGAGDLITDYEGIAGYERYRGDLGLMYFAFIEAATGRLIRLELVPTQMKRFQLAQPSSDDVDWLAAVLDRESRRFHTSVIRKGRRCLTAARA